MQSGRRRSGERPDRRGGIYGDVEGDVRPWPGRAGLAQGLADPVAGGHRPGLSGGCRRRPGIQVRRLRLHLRGLPADPGRLAAGGAEAGLERPDFAVQTAEGLLRGAGADPVHSGLCGRLGRRGRVPGRKPQLHTRTDRRLSARRHSGPQPGFADHLQRLRPQGRQGEGGGRGARPGDLRHLGLADRQSLRLGQSDERPGLASTGEGLAAFVQPARRSLHPRDQAGAGDGRLSADRGPLRGREARRPFGGGLFRAPRDDSRPLAAAGARGRPGQGGPARPRRTRGRTGRAGAKPKARGGGQGGNKKSSSKRSRSDRGGKRDEFDPGGHTGTDDIVTALESVDRLATALAGYRRWRANDAAIGAGRPLPASAVVPAVAAAVAAVVVVVGVLVGVEVLRR